VFGHRQVIGDGPIYPTQENIMLFKMLVDVIMLCSRRRSISMVLLHIYLMINSIKYINKCQLCSIFILLISSMKHYFLFPLSSSRHTYSLRNHLYTLVPSVQVENYMCTRENIHKGKFYWMNWDRTKASMYTLCIGMSLHLTNRLLYNSVAKVVTIPRKI
jgi:hypothetical protein